MAIITYPQGLGGRGGGGGGAGGGGKRSRQEISNPLASISLAERLRKSNTIFFNRTLTNITELIHVPITMWHSQYPEHPGQVNTM